MQVAEMYQLLGESEKSIELSYLAYKKGQSSPDIHRSYLSIFLRLENKIDFERDVVEENTAILIANEQGERWITILSLLQPEEALGEYSIASTQAKLLLGHKVGDKIQYKDSPLEKVTFEIREIQSIYVRAYQEIFTEYGFRFPEDNNIQKIQIENNDFSNFFLSVARMSLHADKVLDLYRNGGITVEQFCNITGKDQLLVLRGLQLSSEKITASRGTPEEQIFHRSVVRTSNNVTLSISALITLGFLDVLPLLTKKFKKIYVHQQLIDHIDIKLFNLNDFLGKESSTVGYHDGIFYMDETLESQAKEDIQFIQNLKEFVNKYCEVVAVDPKNAKHLLNPTLGNLAPVGEISHTSIIIAKQTNSPLYSDEWILNHFASVNYSVASFWSQAFFENLLELAMISHQEYSEYCCKLIKGGYHFVSINSSLAYDVLIQTGFQYSENLELLLGTLRGPDTREVDAVNIAANLIKMIWLGVATQQQRIFVLDRLLSCITTNRISDRVILNLLKILEAELLLAPLHLDDIRKEILNWWQLNQNPDNLFWAPTL